MGIARLDHLVLTVSDIDETVDFYETAIGMRREDFGADRVALTFGEQKINLHRRGFEHLPHAANPTGGSADFCLIANERLATVIGRLRDAGVPLVDGPVARTGSTGPITSVYVRDPDENLVEISTYDRGRPRAPHPYDLLPAVSKMELTSEDITDGRTLNDLFVFAGGNLSPHLAWAGAPLQTRSLALTCYDPDAPTGTGFFHWFVVGIDPSVGEIPRGGRIDGSSILRNDFGNARYDGAAPPANDGPHRYVFAMHALDATAGELGLDDAPSLAAAGFAMTAHTLARGTLTVTYEQL